MARARRGRTAHDISLDEAMGTAVVCDRIQYRISLDGGLKVTASDGTHAKIGSWASVRGSTLRVQFTPGSQTYFSARADRGMPFSERDIAAAVIVAAASGHPDAEKERRGLQPSAVWSHHLAIVGGEDPRRVAATYAPSETKRLSGRVQHMAALGIHVKPLSCI